jgi:thiosulfate reductase/polysulfide reductase chain A
MATQDIARRDFLRLSAIAGGIGASGLSVAFVTRTAQAAAVSDGWIPTCCNMCGGTTGIFARVRDGRVIKIEPNSSNPVGVCNISTDFATLQASGARMCPKGNAGIMSLYDPDRVKKPLKRVGARGAGQWQEISYEQAVIEIAAKLADIKTTSGPDKVVWFTEDNSFVPIQQSFCNVFGTPNFLQHSNLCDVARKFGFERTLGNGRPLADVRQLWRPSPARRAF